MKMFKNCIIWRFWGIFDDCCIQKIKSTSTITCKHLDGHQSRQYSEIFDLCWYDGYAPIHNHAVGEQSFIVGRRRTFLHLINPTTQERALNIPHVMCHQSLTPTATATATDPPPAISPIMHSRLVCKNPQSQKYFQTPKIFQTSKPPKFLDQKSPVHWEAIFCYGTDTQTDDWRTSQLLDWIGPEGRFSGKSVNPNSPLPGQSSFTRLLLLPISGHRLWRHRKPQHCTATYNIVPCSTVQCSTVQCTTLPCIAVQCSVV